MSEVWKPIKGYEGIYEVSSYGRVRSLEHKVKCCVRGKMIEYTKPSVILNAKKERNGYLRLSLYKNRVKRFFSIHRLVADTFIPNPMNLPQVNHKDEDKLNNNVANLEWCTSKYNANHGTRNRRIYENGGGSRHKPIGKYDSDGRLLATYTSIRKASIANNVSESAVSLSAHHRPNADSVFGFFYRFLNGKPTPKNNHMIEP